MFQNTKLPLNTWFLAMYLLSQAKNGISGLDFMRQLGVFYPTAWTINHKLMLAMQDAEANRQLHGRVEMDDAYLGGERTGGKPGRGSENKVPFVVAARTVGSNNKPHRVCLSQIPHRLSDVANFCTQHIARPVTVISDGLACFNAAQQAGVHEAIVTGGGSASAKDHRFQGVTIYLGNLKSAITGTYRHFDFAKYAPRYFAEFQFRFNRREDLRAMLGELLRAAIDRIPSPRRSIRELESCCYSCRTMKLTMGATRRGQLIAIDEILDYFESHPQSRDHGSLPRSVPFACVARGESIDAGGEALL